MALPRPQIDPETLTAVATLLRNTLVFKPRPNDRNISTQHIAILLGATCCMRLATLSRRVGSNLKMVKFFIQHLWMLHDVVVVWPGSSNNVAPGHAH